MDREEVKKTIEDAGVLFGADHLERWAEVYRSFLIDELYAIQKALVVLAWLKSEKNYKLSIDKRTISEASDTLVKMACIRHRFDCDKSGERDYTMLFCKTEGDFLGGLYLKDLVCTLDTLVSLPESDQDRQE